MATMETIKRKLSDFVSKGGNVNDLNSTHQVYRDMVNLKLRDKNDNLISMDQKFAMAGFPRTKKPSVVIDKIRGLLSEYVSNGGDVNSLARDSKIYKYIKDTKVYNDEENRFYMLDEKFALAGFPREVKEKIDFNKLLISKVEDYIEKGGKFDLPAEKYPFFDTLAVVARTKSLRFHGKVARDNVMKNFGYHDYSEIYQSFSPIMQIEKFKDEDGFVDSCRGVVEMQNYLSSCEDFLKMPRNYVIALVGNFNCREYSVSVDYFLQTKQEVEEYIAKGGDLSKLHSRNNKLYSKLKYICRTAFSEYKDSISLNDVLDILEIDSNYRFNNTIILKDYAKAEEKVGQIIAYLKAKAKANKFVTIEDFNDYIDYRAVICDSCRKGLYLTDYLAMHGIKYQQGLKADRFQRTKMNKLPYIEEMRKTRDEFLKINLSQNRQKSLTKQEEFEIYLQVCMDSFNKYKSKLPQFSEEDELGEEV